MSSALSIIRFLQCRSCFSVGFIFRQRIHEGRQALPVILGELGLQCAGKGSFKASFPTRAAVVQIGSASGRLPCWIYLYCIRLAHNTDQGTLG